MDPKNINSSNDLISKLTKKINMYLKLYFKNNFFCLTKTKLTKHLYKAIGRM